MKEHSYSHSPVILRDTYHIKAYSLYETPIAKVFVQLARTAQRAVQCRPAKREF